MNKKSIIVFVLATAVLAGALVFDGVSHRRTISNSQAISQSVTTTQAVGAPENSPNAHAEAQPDISATPTPGMEPAQNPGPDAATQAQGDDSADTTIQTVQPLKAKRTVVAGTVANDDAPQLAAAQPIAAASSVDTRPAPAATKQIVIPAGTVLTVRLGEELGSDISEMGQSFSATLDRDLAVDGKIVIAAGAAVTGKVAFARQVGPLTGEPTLELRVTSVNVNNADLTVVTSIRSFGPKIKGNNKVSRFVKGLLKRYEHEEKEVVLDDQSAYSFALRQPLLIQ
jgi:hypothetical protein